MRFLRLYFYFFVLLVWQLQLSENAALERRTLRAANNVAENVEAVLDGMKIALQLVSSSKELADGDLEDFHAKTQFALEGAGSFVLVVDETGQQLVNTRVPYGTKLGKTSDLESLKETFEKNEVHVSGLFLGRTSGRWVFNVMKSLEASDKSPARAIITTRNAASLKQIFGTVALPAQWHSYLLDDSDHIIMTSRGENFSVGQDVKALDDEALKRFY